MMCSNSKSFKIRWLLFLFCTTLSFFPKVNAQADYKAELDTLTIGTNDYFIAYENLLNTSKYTNKLNVDSFATELIRIAKQFNRPKYEAIGLYIKAQMLENDKKYDVSLQLLQAAIAISKSINDHASSAEILGYMGVVQAHASKEYDKGIPFIEESNVICRKHNLDEQLSFNYYYMGYFYTALYEESTPNPELQKNAQSQDYLLKAAESFDKALKIAKTNKNQALVDEILKLKINILLNLKDYRATIKLASTLLKQAQLEEDKFSIYQMHIPLAKAEFHLNNKIIAYEHINIAIQLIKELGFLKELIDAYHVKHELALYDGDYKTALDYYVKQKEIQDSLWTTEKQLAFEELNVTYETEKKEKENLVLSNEKKVLETRNKWAFVTTILSFLGLSTIAFFFYKMRKQNKIIQKQATDLQQQAQLKTRFFNNVAHELRTPLTLILGPINAALKRNKLATQDFTYLKMARRNGNQLLLLVNSILDLSKLEVNKLTLEESAIDFYPLIRRLVAAFESSAEIQGIHLTLNYPTNMELPIQLDVSKFEIIMNNLLSNALKFTPKNGKIAVHVQAHPKQIEIQVADTGKGIEVEDLPFIFDRYYQTKKSNQPLEGGTGIGLALCKEYAQLFKGAITVKSVVGKGSTFTLVFPKKEANTLTIPIETALPPFIENSPIEILPAPITNGQKDKAHLLIVEDNKDMRLYIQNILRDTFQCHTAENGQVAWEYLNDAATIQPDLIISDLMMPFMDGFELLEKIKAGNQWRTTPVIMLTARSAKEDRLKALTIGIDDYLTKPFDSEELVARVNNLLQNHLARKLQFQTQLPTAKGTPPPDLQFKPVTAADIEWIRKVNEQIKADIGKFDLNLLNIAHKMAISERHLRRRILEITGMKAGVYLKEIRLQQARHFLEFKVYLSVAEVGYAVGFNTPNYFAKIYKARFGKLPKTYF